MIRPYANPHILILSFPYIGIYPMSKPLVSSCCSAGSGSECMVAMSVFSCPPCAKMLRDWIARGSDGQFSLIKCGSFTRSGLRIEAICGRLCFERAVELSRESPREALLVQALNMTAKFISSTAGIIRRSFLIRLKRPSSFL